MVAPASRGRNPAMSRRPGGSAVLLWWRRATRGGVAAAMRSDGEADSGPRDPTPMDEPYLLVVPIPFYRDETGAVWMMQAWERDFRRHLEYLTRLTLLSPQRAFDPSIPELVRLAPETQAAARFAALPAQDSLLAALCGLPRSIRTAWREVARATVVHSGVAGWPIPLGWITNPIALLRKRRLVIVVESAPWRLVPGQRATVAARLRAWLTERLARFFARRADLFIATQPSYVATLHDGERGRGASFVNPASWIDEEEMVGIEAAEHAWQRKREETPRLLFAGRLLPEKGVALLLEAARELLEADAAVEFHVIGEGPLREAWLGASRAPWGERITVLDPVPYGAPFLDLLRDHHAVLVPSLSDEQPRILFDAYSQAVPVIASDTDGIRPHVRDGQTGWLVAPGSRAALVRAIRAALGSTEELARRGLAARDSAASMTHREMHRSRSEALATMLHG